eukprot:gene10046-2365_t
MKKFLKQTSNRIINNKKNEFHFTQKLLMDPMSLLQDLNTSKNQITGVGSSNFLKEMQEYERTLKGLMEEGKENEGIQVRDKMWKLYYKNKEVLPAEKILQENIEAKKDVYGIVSEEIADDYGSLSEILLDKFRLEEALELRQKSIEIKKNLNLPSVEIAKDWTEMGIIRKLMKDIDLAKSDFEHSFKIFEENEKTNTEEFGKCLFELSCIYQEEKNPKTIEYLQRVVNIPSLSDDLKSKSLIQLGTACMHKGESQRAEKNFQEAFSIMRNNQNMDKTKLAESIYSLGVLYATEKKNNLAQEFILEAIKLFEDSEEKRLFLVPRCYMTLGKIYKESKPKKSIEMFQKALHLTPSFMGLNAGDHSFIFSNIAEIYLSNGDYETAYQYLEKASNTIKLSRSPDAHRHIAANILMNTGIYYSKMKDYENAELKFKESFDVYLECFDDNFAPESAEIAYHIGVNSMNLQKWKDALKFLIESRDIYMSLDHDLYKVPEILDFIVIANQHVYEENLKGLSDSFTNSKEEYELKKKSFESEYQHVIETNNFRKQMIEKRPLLDELGEITEEEFNSIYKAK